MPWYALTCHRNKQRAQQALSSDTEVEEYFLPAGTTLAFARTTDKHIEEICQGVKELTFYSVRFLSIYRRKVIISDREMSQFKLIAGHPDGEVFITDKIEKGDKIRIINGQFTGVQGILVSSQGARKKRVVVALEGLQVYASCNIEPSDYEVLEYNKNKHHFYDDFEALKRGVESNNSEVMKFYKQRMQNVLAPNAKAEAKLKELLSKCLILVMCLLMSFSAFAQAKREFRGAWIQAVNGQFQGMSATQMQQTLTYQLDELAAMGVNAIIFQVRPECDALYASNLEPWSRFLTGTQGKSPGWDPLAWMVTECHKRNMEIHAWINPYRAKTKGTTALATNHICVREPNAWFEYDGQYILNPALPENRAYICQVARDIVSRYDIDGFHIDDYFYPYPAAGATIPDEGYFRVYNRGGFKDIKDWRRDNVNVFMKELSAAIHSVKPWVKFGVSPFGIYRNKATDALNGSNTNGLQNYDDLYADVLLWVNNGWVDYCVPQIYWEIGNKAADYDTLIKWWNKYCGARPLYIGEDIERTAKYADPSNPGSHQMGAKYKLHDALPNVKGTVLWYAKAAVDNVGNYGTALKNNYWKYPALQPTMNFLCDEAPAKVKKLKPVWTEDGYILFWTAPSIKKRKNADDTWRDTPTKYVVYRFNKGESINTNDPSKIIAITSNTYLSLPYDNGKTTYTYVVTALNRPGNEGPSAKAKVKL